MRFSSVLIASVAFAGTAIRTSAEDVEVHLVAKKSELAFGNGGVSQTMYTYNGTVPGPAIEANVGDTLRVYFKNELEVETTVHWHGVEVPAIMDGSSISQDPVLPGESFTYQFELLRAATHWYHPHIMASTQVEMGLYGALVIRDPEKDSELPSIDHVAVLDDVLLDSDGTFKPHLSDSEPVVKAEMLLNGRIGNTRLVNGNIVPDEEETLKEGVPIRLRFINVANTLFMRLSFPGQEVFKIASDGGLLETPIKVLPIDTLTDEEGSSYSDPDPSKGLMLTPGERAEVVFAPSGPGPFMVEWHDFPVGRHEVTLKEDGTIGATHSHPLDGRRPKETLIEWAVDTDSTTDVAVRKGSEYVPPSGLVEVERITPTDEMPIGFEFGHGGAEPDGDVPFFAQIFNGTKLHFNNITSEIAPSVKLGESRFLEVANTDGHDHNFHLHGFHFQHVNTRWILSNGTEQKMEANPIVEWRDTILMPRRPEAGGQTVLRLAARFGDEEQDRDVCAYGKNHTKSISGGWLAHCHMFEHGDYGMMSFLQVTGCTDKEPEEKEPELKEPGKKEPEEKDPKDEETEDSAPDADTSASARHALFDAIGMVGFVVSSFFL